MRRLLLAGFGPFPGAPANPSGVLARRVAALPRWRTAGVEVRALVLPVTWREVPGQVTNAIAAFRPDAVLLLGLAGRARWVRVETVARGRAGALRPDEEGRAAPRVPGALLRQARAAANRLVPALRAAGLDARPSPDAGAYLCDLAFHASLGAGPRGRVAFLHIPRVRGGGLRCGHGSTRPGLASLERGVVAAVRALARPARLSPGGP